MPDYKINILHLYPDLLNLHGDKGNIECMRKRLEWRGISANVSSCTLENPEFDLVDIDIAFLGGGSDREMIMVMEKLLDKKQEIAKFVEGGGTLIANCEGYQILGKYYPFGDELYEGLGILDIYTEKPLDGSRFIGDAVAEIDGLNDKIVGFENHSGRTDIGSYTPLGHVIKGFGNDGKSGYEGVIYKNLVGTYIHGPLLPKNPELCDKVLQGALKHKYPEFKELSLIDDGVEKLANQYMQSRL